MDEPGEKGKKGGKTAVKRVVDDFVAQVSLGSVTNDKFPLLSKTISDSLKPYFRSKKST